jgi:hypothetical protein
MPVSFDTSVTNENLAPEDDDVNKRKFHARPPQPRNCSIDEDDSDTAPPGHQEMMLRLRHPSAVTQV